MNTNIHIFYHSKDLDGKCSGFLLHNKFPEAILYPFNYGQPFPWDEIEIGSTVYMADISLPLEDMIRLSERSKLFWIDHHRRAIDEILPHLKIINRVLNSSVSACYLTWELLNTTTPPEWVKLLSLYDTWNHDDFEYNWRTIQLFQYGMSVHKTNPTSPIWNSLMADPEYIDFVIEDGIVVKQYVKRQQEKIIKNLAYEIDWEGYHCCVINDNSMRNDVPRGGDIDIGITFSQRKDRKWEVSLRTRREDIDVSLLAKKYNGGGHPKASAFTCDRLPWED